MKNNNDILKSVVCVLNRYINYSYKLKQDNENNFILYKQFHQLGKYSKYYRTELFKTNDENIMLQFVKGLIADKDYSQY